MNLLSIALVGFGLVAIGGGVLMTVRPDDARRIQRKVAGATGPASVAQGERWGAATAITIILLVAVGVLAIAIGLLTWR